MNSDEQKRLKVENYIKSYNSFDINGMTIDLAKDVIFENVSNGKIDVTTNGIDEFRIQAEKAKSLFVSREQKITAINSNRNTLSIKIDYTGVLNIDLPTGLKKGESIHLKGESIFTFENNKIIKIRDVS
ncbi:nuclear transport factor 2 family protein [Aquimarina longa]|uniref:nuclear transport factor 2 family protein n=1 Tax=Aquimarina longa TaxID=1080221 RepID=UPI00078661ED|nr:nuclear transport factor 2 family protein [Aquimarina longa]